MNHLAYVIASYASATVTLALTIGWVLLDQRLQKAELKRLEAQGVRRRSARIPE